MSARASEITTPNHRAEPPSAVKNVEESRQQRLQRAQSRFRDRGGIFVPTNRNTLIDILLGKKDASPKRSRRSRSRSVSPQKPLASPTHGRAKRVSLSSSTALAMGEISAAQPELRRSPRKKSTTVSSKSSTSRKTAGVTKHTKDQEPDTEDEAFVVTKSKSGKGKRAVKVPSAELHSMDETAKIAKGSEVRGSKANAKEPVKRGRKTKGVKEPEASTSRLSSQDLESDADDIPRPKSRTKKPTPKKKGKTSKSTHTTTDDEEDDDDIPLATIKSRTQATKRKLSIVQEEEEEPSEVAPVNGTRPGPSAPSPPPPSRKRPKVVPPPDRSPSPPLVNKPKPKRRTPNPSKAPVPNVAKKTAIFSEDEDDPEPPLPKGMQKNSRVVEDEPPARSSKKPTKGKAKAPAASDVEDEVEPTKLHKGKGKAGLQDESQRDALPHPVKKATSVDDDDPPRKGGGRSKRAKEASTVGQTTERTSKDAVKPGKRDTRAEDSDVEVAPPKRSRSKAKETVEVLLDEEDSRVPAKPKRKRSATVPDEDEVTPTKKVKTLPLREVDEQSPPSKRKGGKGGKVLGKAKPPSKADSRKLKENTPMSDCSDGRSARQTRSRSKPSSKISGPRKSVMIRMKEPLPPMEDNDPDPIDFLS